MGAATRFVDRYRCPVCYGKVDFADPDHGTCTRCGDEWPTESFAPDAFDHLPDACPVGDGDLVTFKFKRGRNATTHLITGMVVKVNRKTVQTRALIDPATGLNFYRTVHVDRVDHVTYPTPAEEAHHASTT